jgi:GWxTD domain-containing protein
MKKITFLLVIILNILLNYKSSFSENELNIAMDASVFHFDENETKWEFYYSIPDNMFTYIADENGKLNGKIAMKIVIKNDIMEIINEEWHVGISINSFNDLKKNYIFGIKNFYLQPGQYNIDLYAFDENAPDRKLNLYKDLIISKFENFRINQSEIVFASYLEKIADSKLELDHTYMRYDYYLVPNPRAEFFGNEAKLIGALEVYNTHKYAENGFTRSYKISDNAGYVLYYKKDTNKTSSETMLTTFNIPLDTLNSGVYYFTLTTNYPIDNPTDSVSSSKKFFYYNQHKPPVARRNFTENVMFENSEFNAMGPEQTDLEIEMTKVIANDEEIYQAKSLTDMKAKQRFLFKFWKVRDSDTNTLWNETLITFRRNAEFANKFFAYGKNLNGWKTERGKVLLKYGVPTQRDIKVSTGSERAYEEWFYENVQGGVYFYFVDVSSIGNHILVHSTAMDEPYNPYWYNRYVPSTQDLRMQQDLDRQRSVNPYGN